MSFKRAERKNARLRLAISGPAGSGKTFSAIMIARLFSARVAVLDSERGSAEKYARKAGAREGAGNWDFDHANLDDKNPQEYLAKIKEAAEGQYPVLVIDSYTHSWLGALELIDKMGGWVKGGKIVSPLVAKVVDAILAYPGHVIATMRSKPEHVIEKDERTGKITPRKVGMGTVAREGTDYEFDVMLDMALDGTISVSKTRCSALAGNVYTREDVPKIAAILRDWLDEGAPVSVRDSLAEAIRFAQTDADLSALVSKLNALKTESPSDFVALKPIYLARKSEIATASEVP